MKTSTRSIRLRLLTLAAAVLSLATLGASHARAQANLTFSGGLGGPLTLTLNAPVTYLITTASGGAPLFDFQGVGNVFSSFPSISGTITFTINGGAAQTINSLSSGFGSGSVAVTDAFIFGTFPSVVVGDTVVLQAGQLTANNFAGAPPASGSYPTFVFDGNGTKLDAVNGMSVVPEPSTWAAVAAGMGLLGVVSLRRRGAAGAVVL